MSSNLWREQFTNYAFRSSFQSFETQVPQAEWKYTFPKTNKNAVKKYKLHVNVNRFYLFVEVPIAQQKLDVEITGKWKTCFFWLDNQKPFLVQK